MSTELSFLIELLLQHKLPQKTKDLVAERIKHVEAHLSDPARVLHSRPLAPAPQYHSHPALASQAPSTQALLAKHPDLAAAITKSQETTIAMAQEIKPEPAPVEVVAQTPAAMAAMESRNKMIRDSMSGKRSKNAPLVTGS